MPLFLKKATVDELARSLIPAIEAALPEGVRFMIVVTDFENIGVAGSLAPVQMGQACVNILDQLPAALAEQEDSDVN